MPEAGAKPFENLEDQLSEDLKGLLEKGRTTVKEYHRYLELKEAPRKNGNHDGSFRKENTFKTAF